MQILHCLDRYIVSRTGDVKRLKHPLTSPPNPTANKFKKKRSFCSSPPVHENFPPVFRWIYRRPARAPAPLPFAACVFGENGAMMKRERPLNILLISTYELGRQPFGLASPAAWLRSAGFEVECLDLSRDPIGEAAVSRAEFIAFYVPMHTATRLAIRALPSILRINPQAHLCFYGLYAPMNETYLRRRGAQMILGGEFEAELVRAAERVARSRRDRTVTRSGAEPDYSGLKAGATSPELQMRDQPEPIISLSRLKFRVPDRHGLPEASRYARLENVSGGARVTGYTEASRGCKHLCRHCPVVPVYQGRFRIVQPEVVLEDIRRQVAAGAQHITFGDPDFFNGIRHAVSIVNALHREYPALTYDVTIKVEHLLKHAEFIPALRDTGCAFVTTAVESFDDGILARLEKGHTRADFFQVLELSRKYGLGLAPTFVAFTPWTMLEGYCDFLDMIAKLDLVENVAPVQFCMRLLIPSGSRLLELEEIQNILRPFDEAKLMHPWQHADPRVDHLYEQVQTVVGHGLRKNGSRRGIYERVRRAAQEMARGAGAAPWPDDMPPLISRSAIPYLTEPWYC
jgi:radical SAM superfamily enzyme YgiQ (UPF0313 family)